MTLNLELASAETTSDDTTTDAWDTVRRTPISLSMGENGYSSVTRINTTWGDLLPSLACHREQPYVDDKKKLPVYAPCILHDYTVPPPVGARRPKNLKNVNVAEITMLVFDVDNANLFSMQSPLQATTWLVENGVAHAYHSSWSSKPERPKFRIVVPVTQPVVLATDQDRAAYKLAYERAMAMLGIDGDPSCSDAAQYYISPAVPNADLYAATNKTVTLGAYEDGKAHYGDWRPGQAFDLAVMVEEARQHLRSKSANRKATPQASASKDSHSGPRITQQDLKTKGLFDFNAKYRTDFDVEAFVEHYEDDGIRGPAAGGGLHCQCPNQHGEVTGRPHTDDSDTSTAFWVRNPEDGKGYVIKCHTAGCTEHFGGDALLFLDALCVRYGIEDAQELIPFSETAQCDAADGGPFRKNEKGKVAANEPENIRLAVKKLGIKLTFNELSARAHVDGLWNRGTDLDDAAMNRFRLRMKDEFDFLPAKELFCDVISDLARQSSFHPVLDYLDDVQPQWDGIPRIDKLLITYFGAADTPFNREVGKLWMIAAVRRMRNPGCKFDELLVLISGQGAGKSSGIATLTGSQEWFTDCLPMNASPKETIERTRGKWVGEIAELQGNHREVETIKAFLSRQVDTARGSYGRLPEDVKRAFVCIGTTNSAQFLKDRTGNRRFWPVEVGKIDIAAIKRDRDQLWAEAATLEAADPRDGAIRLDRSLWAAAGEAQEKRMVANPYREALEAALGDRTGRISSEDVYRLLGVPVERRHQTMTEMVAEAMRDLGWVKLKVKFSGTSLWGYVKGSEVERTVELQLIKDDIPGRLRLAPDDIAANFISSARNTAGASPAM